jgi:predicted TIM-barrel fold metal-dependent hydrolase
MKNLSRRSSSPPSPDDPACATTAPAGLVDAHVHVFPPEVVGNRETFLGRDGRFDALYGSPKARMATADEVVRHMDEVGVAVSVVFGFAFGDQGLCRLVNDYVMGVVKARPDRFVGLACVAPGAPGAREELERCLDAGLRGCGELTPDDAGPEEIRVLAPLVGCLEERGLPLMVHASEPVGHHYPGKGKYTTTECVALAQAYPGLRLVFSHMGGGLFLYELMPEVRDILSNVYYDTAAVPYLYDPRVYQVAVSCTGVGKLIFGSDYPLLSPSRYYKGLAGLAEDVRAQVNDSNARRLFGI